MLVKVPRGLANVVAVSGNPARWGVSMTNAPRSVVPSPHFGSERMMLVCSLFMAARNDPAAATSVPGDCCEGPAATAEGVLAFANDAHMTTAATETITKGDTLVIEFPLLNVSSRMVPGD